MEALGDVALIPAAQLGFDVQRCPISRDERERREPCYCGPKSLTCKGNSLETTNRCPCDIVGLKDRAKQGFGFGVQTSDCG